MVHGRWYGVRGHRFVRPALILTGDGGERRLLADLDDKPWVAEDGDSWRAAFAVESAQEIDGADGLELSVAPDINIALRSDGVNADGPIVATGRVSEESAPAGSPASEPSAPDTPPASPPDPASPAPGVQAAASEGPDLPFPTPPRRRRDRGVPPDPPTPSITPQDVPATPIAPRPRPVPSRAPDVERLTSRLRAAEATLERERSLREEVEQSLERERSDARRTAAELGRVKAELELARAAEGEAADTASALDAARRDNHEIRVRHEMLRADHDRALRTQAELEQKLEARTTELQEAREEISGEHRHRRDTDSRVAGAGDPAVESGHRPPAFHGPVHTPPPPRTDRPINPSLRQRPWLRLLVVLVIAGVLLAIYLVLHSTVLH